MFFIVLLEPVKQRHWWQCEGEVVRSDLMEHRGGKSKNNKRRMSAHTERAEMKELLIGLVPWGRKSAKGGLGGETYSGCRPRWFDSLLEAPFA